MIKKNLPYKVNLSKNLLFLQRKDLEYNKGSAKQKMAFPTSSMQPIQIIVWRNNDRFLNIIRLNE